LFGIEQCRQAGSACLLLFNPSTSTCTNYFTREAAMTIYLNISPAPDFSKFSAKKSPISLQLAIGLIAFTILNASDSPASVTQPEATQKALLIRSFGKRPLSFEANRGQTDPTVRFLSRGQGYSLFLTSSEAVLTLRKVKQALAFQHGRKR
jgi:hypothetical protein